MVESSRLGCMLRTMEAYNLSPDTTLFSARSFFEEMGEVECVSLKEMTVPTENKKIVCASAVFHRSEDALKAVKEFSGLKREGREEVSLSLSHGHMLEGMQKRLEGIIDVGSHRVKPLCLSINTSNDTGGERATQSPSSSMKQYTGTVFSLSPEEGNGFIRADLYRRIKLLFQLSQVESQTPLKIGDPVKYAGWRNEEGLWVAADVVKAGPTITFYSPKNEKRNRSHIRCCRATSHECSKTPPNSRIPKGGSSYFNARRDNYATNRASQHFTMSRGPLDSGGFGNGRGSRIL